MIYPPWNWQFGPENKPYQKERIVFQPCIFSGKLLVLGRVISWWLNHPILKNVWLLYDWKKRKKIHRFPPSFEAWKFTASRFDVEVAATAPTTSTHRLPRRKKTHLGPTKKHHGCSFPGPGWGKKPSQTHGKNMCCLVVVGTWNAPIFYQNSYHVFFALTATQTHATPAFLHCSHLQGTLGFLLHVFVFSAGSHWRYRWWFRHPGKNNHLGWEVKTPVVKKMGISSTRSTPKDGFCWTKIPGKKHLDWLVVGFWHPFETYFLSNWFNIFSLIFRGWTFQKIVEKPPPMWMWTGCDVDSVNLPNPEVDPLRNKGWIRSKFWWGVCPGKFREPEPELLVTSSWRLNQPNPFKKNMRKSSNWIWKDHETPIFGMKMKNIWVATTHHLD